MSAGAYGPLDPLQGDIFSGSPVSATVITPLLLSALRARTYTSIRALLLQMLQYLFVILSSAFLLSSRSLVLCSVALRVMDLLSLWTL